MDLELSKFTWYNKNNIWVTGFLRKGDLYMTGYSLVEYFLGISSFSEFEVILKAANGQFSVIIRSGTDIWAATDRLRNYPIFYMFHGGEYILSDDCYKLTRIQNEYKLCKEAFDCFLSNGFVLNNLTLADKIFQIEAGELVDLGEIITRKFYFDFNSAPILPKSKDEAAEELGEIIDEVLKNHFKALEKRFVAIALSGGYDSRLLATFCARHHPDNIVFYTYGIRDNADSVGAIEIARRLGIECITIVYNSELIKGFLHDDTFMEYYPYVSDLTSMFFMQEYFAVKYLHDNKLVPDSCVFITGFSGDMMAGGHLTPQMRDQSSRARIAEMIFNKYCNQVKISFSKKSEILGLICHKIPEDFSVLWKIFESWDQKERQAKFIVNSAKVYSFFGYDYSLPLFDNELTDFFSALPFSLKFNKNLYDFVLREHVFSKYNLNLKNELNPLPSQKALQRVKERIKKLFPYRIREWFISHESVILYDEITRLMIDEIDPSNLIIPKQSNYYNSYITQWYLLKTSKFLNR